MKETDAPANPLRLLDGVTNVSWHSDYWGSLEHSGFRRDRFGSGELNDRLLGARNGSGRRRVLA